MSIITQVLKKENLLTITTRNEVEDMGEWFTGRKRGNE